MPLTLTATSTEFITLTEVKAHLNITATRDDVELVLIKGAAQEQVEAIIGPVLHRTVTEVARVRYGSAILSVTPILSVTQATSGGLAFDSTVGLKSGVLDSRLHATADVSVTYVAGRSVASDSMRLAALIIADHLWKTQRGGGPSSLDEVGDLVETPIGFAIPRRASDLLRREAIVSGIA